MSPPKRVCILGQFSETHSHSLTFYTGSTLVSCLIINRTIRNCYGLDLETLKKFCLQFAPDVDLYQSKNCLELVILVKRESWNMFSPFFSFSMEKGNSPLLHHPNSTSPFKTVVLFPLSSYDNLAALRHLRIQKEEIGWCKS